MPLQAFSALLFAAVLQTTPSPAGIVGGRVSAPGAWPAVVSISGDGPCSGILIAADIVLTAAHCLPTADGVTLWVGFGNEAPGDPRVRVAAAVAHPDFCGQAKCGDAAFDFAFLRLEQPVADVEPLRLVLDQDTWDAVMHERAALTLVGFGNDETETGGTLREVTVPLERFSDQGLQFSAGGNGFDSCNGDSGGPALVRLNDEWLVAGVLSEGSEICGSGAAYGVPHAAAPWLVREAGFMQDGACYDLDCIDTAPEPEGCECTSPSTPPPAAWWLLALGLLGIRRRKR